MFDSCAFMGEFLGKEERGVQKEAFLRMQAALFLIRLTYSKIVQPDWADLSYVAMLLSTVWAKDFWAGCNLNQ